MISAQDIQRWFESPHYRKKSDWICIDQPKVIREWVDNQTIGQVIHSDAIQAPQWAKPYDCLVVPNDWFVRITNKPSHPGIMVIFERPVYNVSLLMRSRSTLILDGIQDPGNMGTIIRAMVAFGCQSLCLTNHCVDPFHPKSVSASAGAIGFVKGIYYEHHWADWLRSVQSPIYVLQPLACESIWDVRSGPYVLVCGSEGRGIQSSVIHSMPFLPLAIPISDQTESLNAAMSVGIALNHLSRPGK